MASEKNLNAVFTDIANAIRDKKGTVGKIKPINMAEEVASIEVGSETPSYEGSYQITENGTYHTSGFKMDNDLEVSVIQKGTIAELIQERGCKYLFYYFRGSEITTLSYSDTSNATSMDYMFSNSSSLTAIPLLDTSNVTSMSSMFSHCKKLTAIPLLDTSNVTSMSYMLEYCNKLTSVPALDVSNVTDMRYMFYSCGSLKSILIHGMKSSFDISSSTKFEESDLVTILNNLAEVAATRTLTMGSTNLAKLTDEEKAIATNKGWTLK